MALLRLEGQFKGYAELLVAYGIIEDADTYKDLDVDLKIDLDDRWKAFLQKIGSTYALPDGTPRDFTSGKHTMLANYNALDMTFDAMFIMPKLSTSVYDPRLPGSNITPPPPPAPAVPVFPLLKDEVAQRGKVVMVPPNGEERRYANNMPIRVLSRIDQTDADKHIYCKSCGYQVELETRYDFAPEFTWEELFAGDAGDERKMVLDYKKDPVVPYPDHPLDDGVHTNINVCKDGLIWCPMHRDYGKFETITSSIATGMALTGGPITQSPITTVNSGSGSGSGSGSSSP